MPMYRDNRWARLREQPVREEGSCANSRLRDAKRKSWSKQVGRQYSSFGRSICVVTCQAMPMLYLRQVAATCFLWFELGKHGRYRELGASTGCSHYRATAAYSLAKACWRYNMSEAGLGEQPVYKACSCADLLGAIQASPCMQRVRRFAL